jgi:hypothetical protein
VTQEDQAGFGKLSDLFRRAKICRRLGNASLLNAMAGEIDDMNLDGIVIWCAAIRCELARAASDQATTATA